MSFLATAPDDGYPGPGPVPGPSAWEAGTPDAAPQAGVTGPAGVAVLAGLAAPAGPAAPAALAAPAGPAAPAALAAPAGLAAPASPTGRTAPAGMASLAGGAGSGGEEKEPLLDPTALQDLGAELDNPAVARDFARDYIRMWDRRYRSLASALERGDDAEALDAALSLKISSAMAGGVRLARLAGDIEDAIRSGELDRARSFLPEVAEHGRETMAELQASQDRTEP